MTSGFRHDNPSPTAKTNGSGRIGLERLAIRSVEVDEVLPKVAFGQQSVFVAGSSLDLCETN